MITIEVGSSLSDRLDDIRDVVCTEQFGQEGEDFRILTDVPGIGDTVRIGGTDSDELFPIQELSLRLTLDQSLDVAVSPIEDSAEAG